MDETKVLMLAQLVNNLSESLSNIEKFYQEQNKTKFETSKKALLESQKKISIFLAKGVGKS